MRSFTKLILSFLTLMVLTDPSCLAQKYSTIVPLSECFFSKDYSKASRYAKIVATRFTDVSEVPNGKEYRSFESMRLYKDYADGEHGNCDYYIGHSWAGPRVVVDSSGWDYHFNDSFEQIAIKRNAKFNDTFLMYTYPSGEKIHAVVTAEYWDRILSKDQRLKVLSLISDKPGFPNNEIEFILSEYYGWVKWFEPAHFPLNLVPGFKEYLTLEGIDSKDIRAGVTRLKRAEVHDYQPGDVFRRGYGNGYFDQTIWVITKRTDFEQSDAVEYEAIKTREWYQQSAGKMKRFNDTSRVVLRYDNLSDFVTNRLPDEVEYDTSAGQSKGIISPDGHPMSLRWCGNYQYLVHEETKSYGSCVWLEFNSLTCIDEVWGVDPMDQYVKGPYGEGVGSLEGDGFWMNSFHKAGTTCGEPSPLSIKKLAPQKMPFPNPSSGIFTLPQIDIANIELVNVGGQSIQDFTWTGNKLDLSNLPDGIYHATITDGDRISQFRLFKLAR